MNEDRIFTPKINNPLDDVMEILEDPNVEHKKTTFPYVEPTVQLPDQIESTQKLIDNDYADLFRKSMNLTTFWPSKKNKKKLKML